MSAVLDSLAFVFVVSVVLVIMIELIKGLFRNGLERRLDALLRVEAKIDLLLERAGIEFDPYRRFPQEVVGGPRSWRKNSSHQALARVRRSQPEASEGLHRRVSAPQSLSDGAKLKTFCKNASPQ